MRQNYGDRKQVRGWDWGLELATKQHKGNLQLMETSYVLITKVVT